MWPHEEAGRLARQIVDRPKSRVITFETGYGPSGPPHIGTIAEIIRTSYVRQAFYDIAGRPSRLICFSDDLDGLRKDPTSGLLTDHIGRALCDIPSPENPSVSYGQSNINKMIQLVRDFGYTPIVGDEAMDILRSGASTSLNEVLCINSSVCYRSGIFNEMLALIANRVQDVLDVVLPTLGGTGGNRRESYCPFMPITGSLPTREGSINVWGILKDKDGRMAINPLTGDYGTGPGYVVQNVYNWNVINDSLYFQPSPGPGEHDSEYCADILSGGSKLQWKVDWCMRWAALGVDYEMHGKDLQSSVQVGKAILTKLGLPMPITMQYELMLDAAGAKQSKSKGNGIDINDWVKYGIDRALNYYLTYDPSKARKVTHDTILVTNDELLNALRSFDGEINELWHVYGGDAHWSTPCVPGYESDLTFGTVVSFVNLINADDPALVERLIGEYHSALTISNCPMLESIIRSAINWYVDVIRPTKNPRNASDAEKIVLQDLANTIRNLDVTNLNAEQIQFHIYECGKRHVPQKELKKFFQMLYEVLLGASQGPRLGTMIQIIGAETFISLVEEKI